MERQSKSIRDYEKLRIRKARDKDIDRILDLLVQVNNVHHEGRPDLFLADRTKYSREELETLLRDEGNPIFVAVDENDQVLGYGFCQFQSHVEDNNWPDIVTLYIDDICVDQACRGMHVGRAIYDYVVDFAREAGCYNLTLNVWEKNPGARAFYESCGMHVQKTGMEMIL